ncbi:uncharacterized protein ACHE_11908S [Aspergillus chevalieri]|uniref:Uncharacterized protein n=1 Tax=Aspergillus chevalieri TaxID=182096 RepID=A0A7R7VGY5_ASPCH|nr:uncharacterized protein ACHE_11908S [Aspergillus chevalieri]BCR84506.1 hypothetical protein ACHE_11908S [Aspergillus chevalieri]
MRMPSTVVKVGPIVSSRGFVKVKFETEIDCRVDKYIEEHSKRESTFHAWMQEGAQMLAPPSFILLEWPWFFE